MPRARSWDAGWSWNAWAWDAGRVWAASGWHTESGHGHDSWIHSGRGCHVQRPVHQGHRACAGLRGADQHYGALRHLRNLRRRVGAVSGLRRAPDGEGAARRFAAAGSIWAERAGECVWRPCAAAVHTAGDAAPPGGTPPPPGFVPGAGAAPGAAPGQPYADWAEQVRQQAHEFGRQSAEWSEQLRQRIVSETQAGAARPYNPTGGMGGPGSWGAPPPGFVPPGAVPNMPPNMPPGWVPPPPEMELERARREPIGAIVLILLGMLFLFNTLGFFNFGWVHHGWPLIIVGIAVWLLARNSGRLNFYGRPGPQPPAPGVPGNAPPPPPAATTSEPPAGGGQ